MTPNELREFLERKKVSIIEIAIKSQVSMPTIYAFLNGKELKRSTKEKIEHGTLKFISIDYQNKQQEIT